MAKDRLSVSWCATNKNRSREGSVVFYKRPFAYTTVSDGHLVAYFASDGYTWGQLKNVSYLSSELHEVIDRFIDDGFSERKLSDFVIPHP